VGLGVLAFVLALGIPTLGAPPAKTSRAGAPSATTFAVMGDSISAGHNPYLTDGVDTTTWISYARSHTVEWVGGWTHPGSTTTDLVDHVAPLGADVLVVLAGTNNVNHGLPFVTAEWDLTAIGDRCACGALLVVAIPPDERAPLGAAEDFNTRLEALAALRGWSYVDPWDAERDGLRWRAGRSYDGLHPVPEVYPTVGALIEAAIVEAAT
jgi:GDSL-like Lipase/Acylhydrolase family